jgi:hypothetical protein
LSQGTPVQKAGAFGKSYWTDKGDTLNGFVTKFRADNRKLADDGEGEEDFDSTYRVKSSELGDEVIHGICQHDEQPKYRDHVFVVGSTGNVATAASSAHDKTETFIMKIKISTMERVWVKQIGSDFANGAINKVSGISCAVTSDLKAVWLVGHVEGGGLIPGGSL